MHCNVPRVFEIFSCVISGHLLELLIKFSLLLCHLLLYACADKSIYENNGSTQLLVISFLNIKIELLALIFFIYLT